MTDHPRRTHFELELLRVSTRRLRPVPRSIEARLPSDRSERLSLFPGWENPDRAELLHGIAVRLEGLDLAADVLLAPRLREAEEIAAGEDARSRYLASASEKGATWPGEALTWSGVDGLGAVLVSYLDGTTLFVDCWGPDAGAVCDAVFDLVWGAVRKLR